MGAYFWYEIHTSVFAAIFDFSIHFPIGVPIFESLYYNASTGVLTCVSTGGPATEVEWWRNGVTETSFPISQMVSNTVTSTYANTLLLNGEPVTVIGNYSCAVTNTRGTTIATSHVELRGVSHTIHREKY